MPRIIPSQLVDHLAGSSRTTCILIKVMPVQPGYAPYGVTTLDRDVAYDDNTGDGPITYVAAIGAEPTTLASAADLSVAGGESQSLMPVFDTPVSEADLVSGAYDFARFAAYLVNYEDLTAGRHILLQSGTLGRNTITDNGMSFTTELRGLTQALKQTITEKWSLSCRATFGSQPIGTIGATVTERYPCMYDAESLWEEGSVDSVGLETTIAFTAAAGLAPPFGGTPGMIRWLTGANAGRSDEVESFDADTGDFVLTFPTMFPIAAADTFEFRDDCPKTPVACKARSNWQWYRGEPTIPVADNGAVAAGYFGGSSTTVTSDAEAEA